MVGSASNTSAAIRSPWSSIYVWKQHEILEIPTCYGDHFDVMTGATGRHTRLTRPGLKVLDFHPNIVYLNSSSDSA
jgi:hypothetical protein